MTDVSDWGGILLPSGPEAAVVPADLKKIVNQMAPRLVGYVTTQAERDANYDGFPAGGLVVAPTAGLMAVWMSLGKVGGVQSWETIYQNTGWVTSGFLFGTGISGAATPYAVANDPDYPCKARIKANRCEVYVGLLYNGASTLTANAADGNLTDYPWVQFPNGFRPADNQVTLMQVNGYGAMLRVNGGTGSGVGFMSSTVPGLPIATGSAFRGKFDWGV